MADIRATQTSETDEWSSPLWLYELLDEEFRFGLDPCATSQNALCEHYFTKEDDGLKQPWLDTSFVNPPFSAIAKWTEKCYQTAVDGQATVVSLVPARTDTRYWWSFTRHAEIRFLPGRLRFGGAASGAPFPSAVVIYRKHLLRYSPTVLWWDVKANRRGTSNRVAVAHR